MKVKQLFSADSLRCARTLTCRMRDAHVFRFHGDTIARAAYLVAYPGVMPQVFELLFDPEANHTWLGSFADLEDSLADFGPRLV